MNAITLITPDDAHLHLRDGDYLSRTVVDAARQFGRAIIMPNLQPPVVNVSDAIAYRKRIVRHVPKQKTFLPLMTLYLTDNTSLRTIEEAREQDAIIGCKLYPAHATTHSQAGITDIKKCYPLFAAMEVGGIR